MVNASTSRIQVCPVYVVPEFLKHTQVLGPQRGVQPGWHVIGQLLVDVRDDLSALTEIAPHLLVVVESLHQLVVVGALVFYGLEHRIVVHHDETVLLCPGDHALYVARVLHPQRVLCKIYLCL